MDLLTGIVIVGCFGISGIVILLVLKSRLDLETAKYKEYARRAMKKYEPGSSARQTGAGEVPDWLYDVLDQFGVSEDILDSEEMPPELKKLLPLAKGFIESGGLQKVLGVSGSSENSPAGPGSGEGGPGPWY